MLDFESLHAEPAEEDAAEFLRDAWSGLSQRSPRLPSKYFYDAHGSALFDAICELPEYYVTRTESAIMRLHAPEMAARIGRDALLIEYGSGSSHKTRLLLDALESQNLRPAAYVPLDISRTHLEEAAAQLRRDYPLLQVLPVAADYTRALDLPQVLGARRRAAYFPGSTLGNFEPDEAHRFLKQLRQTIGNSGALLIGLDLKKSAQVLVPAYNDSQGVTAAFNLNILRRANRDLCADFDLCAWSHGATWNEEEGRIEMRLIARKSQAVCISGRAFGFEEGGEILTEYSHKYSPAQTRAMAQASGFEVQESWEDERNYFSVQLWRSRI